ncbi:sigma 54-interacting response regulator [Flavobacterium defluvii]|uniref:DNA-binding transcriptional response regulator, NtrC family, contains REC, AAA-type ATPase, and a Fis-type DNA-binding domains n=1 Tax=Flavobacterium defluvii TaxID=370979 RepID=A0A1M5W3R5_9FLAO|nr:sigma 54-interacting response regulator [Flavobacterium defluvii]SHH81834.1 DNA-binding transcriptional response regulator, NtrC family, contains REC, AAA-type ATPase, and a Fis-type DNA-binding domains [Flavobacterium defluvii]
MGTLSDKNPKSDENDFQKQILIVEDQFIEAHDLQLILEKANYKVIGIVRSVDQALDVIQTQKPDLVFLDIMLKGDKNGIDLAHILKEKNIGFIFISANSSKRILDQAKTTQPYGFIVKPFREQDILTTLEIAFYRQKYSLESQLMQQLELKNKISELIHSNLKLEDALLSFAKTIQTFICFDYLEVGFVNAEQYANLGIIRKNIDQYQIINVEKLSQIADISIEELNETYIKSQIDIKPVIYSEESLINNFQAAPIKGIISHNFGIKSYLVFPLSIAALQHFCFTFYSRNFNVYSNENLKLLSNLENTFSQFISRFYSAEKIVVETKEIPQKKEKTENIKSGFEGIIGNSSQMVTVFNYIKKVAPSDTSVLILGESGTGKEKIAKSIHDLSPRKDKPLIIINCGAIPENLAESLLFGHEKGAFTGATDKRIGKFELANGGTIFLDEIGEMPMELQVKLLRVLQEREIERVGGLMPIKIDVRIIAATNKNLEEEVAAGRFRMDLYYRLHVFPIMVPSLKKRKEDIPELADHFIKIYSERTNRKAPTLSDNALQQITNYDWPGNIRELEHLIQRTLLLTEGSTIKSIEFSPSSKIHTQQNTDSFSIKTIMENERDYILYILKKCNGKISGAGGAAEILDIHPSTLNSKIKKLEIKREIS